MLDFGDGDIELLDSIFDTSEDHALVFQRTGSRNVEFDSQQADHHLRHHADSLHDEHFNDIDDFDTSEDHALVFQRTGSRNVEFDSQQADHHLRHHADSLHDEHFNDIADFDVVELLKSDAALEARFDLAHIILEAAQRTYLALVDHDVVAKQ